MRMSGSFAERTVDNLGRRSVLVRLFRMDHNNHSQKNRVTRTPVSLGDRSIVSGLVHRGRNITQSSVDSAVRGSQPLNPDVDRGPLPLKVVPVPVVDRLGQVERTSIAEVKSGPPHGGKGT